jgi:hypothetical protein
MALKAQIIDIARRGTPSMDLSIYPVPVTEHTVHANGIDIWYVDAGEGIPLLLLDRGATVQLILHRGQ